ncbi:prepilin-type N-terminal cleavage/methylation domain-containing protein [Oceanimonas sp. CAM02]|uniref:prepilin-type N-terminal cleavage/methylation domain-containing protein n=1 Tax=Oceanimonas sp. CAM02 TaxID=3080336 RepID=UPI002935A3D3|nr:prepilin-type N-terminal cleavage/methylation domain-containing protein [Oceanimonas sp. CAM02]MDV2858629.1 prepilin-type N-terminal cleavage/methylation domain-containing protein [Oceanimonas sp. CAM02]
MKQHKGFTLVELVAVLVLVGILAAVAIPRLPIGSDFDDSLQARNLAGLLRLAQLRAMNDPEALQSGTDINRCGVIAVTRAGVSVSNGCSSATLLGKKELAASHQDIWLGAELSVSSNQNLPFTLQFGQFANENFLSDNSYLGRPHINGNPLDSALIITLAGTSVTIEPEGYIYVAR